MTAKIVPERAGLTAAQTRDVHYAYDNRGLQTRARFDSLEGEGVTTIYDGFGRVSSSTLAMAGTSRTLSSLYNVENNRTRLTHPDGAFFPYVHDGLGRLAMLLDRASVQTVDDYVIRYVFKPEGGVHVAVRGAGNAGFSTIFYHDAMLRPVTATSRKNGDRHEFDRQVFRPGPCSRHRERSLTNFSTASRPSSGRPR